MQGASYPDPKRYARFSATKRVAVLAAVCLAAFIWLKEPNLHPLPEPGPPPVAQSADAQSDSDQTEEPLRAEKITIYQPPNVEPQQEAVQTTADPVLSEKGAARVAVVEQAETPTEGTSEPIKRKEASEGAQRLANIVAVGENDLFTKWMEAGLVVLEVTGRSGRYVSTSPRTYERDAYLQTDPRTGLRMDAELTSGLQNRIEYALRSMGIYDQAVKVDIVFTELALRQILELQVDVLRKLDPTDAARVEDLEITVCQNSGTIAVRQVSKQGSEPILSHDTSACKV